MVRTPWSRSQCLGSCGTLGLRSSEAEAQTDVQHQMPLVSPKYPRPMRLHMNSSRSAHPPRHPRHLHARRERESELSHADSFRGRRIGEDVCLRARMPATETSTLDCCGHLTSLSVPAGIDACSGKLDAHWLRAPHPVWSFEILKG